VAGRQRTGRGSSEQAARRSFDEPSLRVCISIHPDGNSFSDLGRVLAPNDPAVWGNGRLDDVGVVVLDEVHYLVGRCTFNR